MDNKDYAARLLLEMTYMTSPDDVEDLENCIEDLSELHNGAEITPPHHLEAELDELPLDADEYAEYVRDQMKETTEADTYEDAIQTLLNEGSVNIPGSDSALVSKMRQYMDVSIYAVAMAIEGEKVHVWFI